MNGRQKTRVAVIVGIALVGLLVYAATGPLRGWLAQTLHGG